jgi:hypothetical protein
MSSSLLSQQPEQPVVKEYEAETLKSHTFSNLENSNIGNRQC